MMWRIGVIVCKSDHYYGDLRAAKENLNHRERIIAWNGPNPEVTERSDQTLQMIRKRDGDSIAKAQPASATGSISRGIV
jgi:hypothetical protein